MMAVMCLDIDGFRMVDDQHCHGYGDELLKVIATKLAHRMRKEDTIACTGGTSF
jgi:diguanylate cyclase